MARIVLDLQPDGSAWRGLLAGAAGGMAMTASTHAEMRLRGRPPSRVPAEMVERMLSIDLDERQERLFTSAGHLATSAGLGIVRGVLSGAASTERVALGAFTALAFVPDFVLIPALGDVPAPWRWSPVEVATSAFHHGSTRQR